MATPFTYEQREQIRQRLEDAARRCMRRGDMRSATVSMLSREAGISKGEFYHFYLNKEHLFFSLLTRLHEEMYQSAERMLEVCQELPVKERTMRAIGEVCRVAKENGTVAFSRTELPRLLECLPQSIVREHFMSDEILIARIIEKAGVKLKTDMSTACATVRILLMNTLLEAAIGERFEEAMLLMLEGACDRILA